MRPSAEEDALRQELAAALKTARKKAGLLQRELGHKTGYSRSRIAGAEAGDYVSRRFCERCDAVLGTTLADTYAAIRALRTQGLLAALAADTENTRHTERATVREISGSAEIRGPEPETGDLRVWARFIGGYWHIAIRLPGVEHGTGNEGTATAG
jgi:transcriptional regulator with XRE-family HTH domain